MNNMIVKYEECLPPFDRCQLWISSQSVENWKAGRLAFLKTATVKIKKSVCTAVIYILQNDNEIFLFINNLLNTKYDFELYKIW